MKKLILPVLALGLCTLSACDKDHDDDHGHVTITFLHPTDNEEIPVAQAADVEIHIKFEWDGDEGEAVEVYLVVENQTNDVIIDFESHQHNKVYEFSQSHNLSEFPPGTEFHLTAKGCEDHDCDEFEEASIHFKLVE